MLNLDALKKAIAEDNEKFKDATAAEKRVLIAQDVLKLLEEKKIQPADGLYFASPVDAFLDFENDSAQDFEPVLDRSLQDVLLTTPVCEVCGIGALFVAGVRRYNQLQVRDANVAVHEEEDSGIVKLGDTVMRRFLSPYFDDVLLGRVETCFEMSDFLHPNEDNFFMVLRAKNWLVEARTTAEQRMAFIMETIVDQKGDFEPWKTVNYIDALQGNACRFMDESEDPDDDDEYEDGDEPDEEPSGP